jgi:hypothetical protein
MGEMMILEPEIIDVSDLSVPRDTAVQFLARVYGIPRGEAEFMVSLERGEVDGDITKRGDDGILRQLNGKLLLIPQAKI